MESGATKPSFFQLNVSGPITQLCFLPGPGSRCWWNEGRRESCPTESLDSPRSPWLLGTRCTRLASDPEPRMRYEISSLSNSHRSTDPKTRSVHRRLRRVVPQHEQSSDDQGLLEGQAYQSSCRSQRTLLH